MSRAKISYNIPQSHYHNTSQTFHLLSYLKKEILRYISRISRGIVLRPVFFRLCGWVSRQIGRGYGVMLRQNGFWPLSSSFFFFFLKRKKCCACGSRTVKPCRHSSPPSNIASEKSTRKNAIGRIRVSGSLLVAIKGQKKKNREMKKKLISTKGAQRKLPGNPEGQIRSFFFSSWSFLGFFFSQFWSQCQ